MMSRELTRLAAELRGIRLEPGLDVPLSSHTTFGIGGPCDLFVEVFTEKQLLGTIDAAQRFSIPTTLLGSGSNLLVRDGGVNGLVIKNSTRGWSVEDNRIQVASGESIAELIFALASDGIGGLEFLAGIPGTLGGAVCGNAGAYGEAIADKLVSLRLYREGGLVSSSPDELEFDYRSSLLKSHATETFPLAVVVGATLAIDTFPKSSPLERVQEILAHRSSRLPPKELGCAGSYFKNLPPDSPGDKRTAAGLLLDQAGAKGLQVGDAEVYRGHANIIINRGQARATHVLTLARQMQALVRGHSKVELEPEVLCIGRS